MTSEFALLYLALQQRLQAIQVTINEGDAPQSAFRFIDQEMGQMEYHNGDNNPPVDWPCVLIDIDDAKFSELGDNIQQGDIKVVIRLGFPPFSGTDLLTPPEFRNKALFFYELEKAVNLVMHGWSPRLVTVSDTEPQADLTEIYKALIRESATTEKRQDFIRVRVLTYSLAMEDHSTSRTLVYTDKDQFTPRISTAFTLPA
jgi:hypothetical protein